MEISQGTSSFENNTILNIDKNQEEGENKSGVDPISLKKWRILNYIKNNPLCTIYKISKKTKINYSQVYDWVKRLVFDRYVCVVQGRDSNGEECELFFIPEFKEEKDE